MSEPTGPVAYCRRWNFKKNKPIDPMTAEQAAARDRTGELYSVTLSDTAEDIIPEAVIERENGHARVWFFDEVGRQSLSYSFRPHGDRLFLHNITSWEYPDDEARGLSSSIKIDNFEYQETGVVSRTTTDKAAGERLLDERTDVDVTHHWEPAPTFGDWGSISRWSRVTPVS
ncbi:hypothetical protein [Catenuloplanes indicus]|uniref:Uncharacterized protein n=1 Tax=Catenuloplanes indicus TaxID=137267 RepID=A0AAE3VWA7_9ACTN|nr:hypothetical protein [Catenuloplanes indicus]MDQ0364432.1 hypothetical protein [Catenuloplanes indicus]